MNIVNTPLRYPGGKQRISPFIVEILQYNDIKDVNYIEPYAGGGGVAINLLLNDNVKKIHLNDKSIPIYSFWKTLIEKPEWLCKKILLSSLTIDEWKKQKDIIKNSNNHSIEEIGFAAFYLNRCNRSGILNGGVIGGLNQKGSWKMDARFSRKNLIERVEAIANKRNSITVTNFDAEILLLRLERSKKGENFIYCDPPYVNKAEKLYLNYYKYEDHKRISELIQSCNKNYWIASYDYNEYIYNLYNKRKNFVYNLQYNASKVYLGQELFIFSDNLKIPKDSIIPRINSVLNNRTVYLDAEKTFDGYHRKKQQLINNA
jgi:DNA adenine methylase